MCASLSTYVHICLTELFTCKQIYTMLSRSILVHTVLASTIWSVVQSNVDDFNNRNLFLTAKLLKQVYIYHKIVKHFLNSTTDTQS